jgi:hypothetical protein
VIALIQSPEEMEEGGDCQRPKSTANRQRMEEKRRVSSWTVKLVDGGTIKLCRSSPRTGAGFAERDRKDDLERASAAGDQVEDQEDDRENQQDVDQTAGDMKSETEEPENEQDYKDCPKHVMPPSRIGSAVAPGEHGCAIQAYLYDAHGANGWRWQSIFTQKILFAGATTAVSELV